MKSIIILSVVLSCLPLRAEAGSGELAFYDIVPFAPGREARTAQDIRAVHGKTGLDTFLYSVSLDPRGYPAFDNVKRATESFRRLKAELGDTPVKLGFLLQSILGHWPRVDREIEPWQRSVNEDGEIKRFCIRDERYQDYIRRTAAALAAEKPCFILGDDDIRAFSPRLECFCPLHTAEFNRRAGTSFTPERYRAAVKACREGDAVATVCAQLRDEIPMTAAKLIREGIDSVDPTIPSGACMPGAEQLLAGPRAKVLAGKGNPVTLRLANGQYSEIDRKDLTGYVLKTQAFIDLYRGSVDRILDESDTFPHTLYARSGRSFGAKLALGIFSGIRGAKLWFVGMHKGGERVPEAHDRALGENMPRFEEMARALDGSTPLGVRVPAFRKVPPLRAGGPDFFAASAWPNALLGVYGIPFFADFSRMPGEVVLLGGAATVDRLTDAELDELFRGKVLADGPAALRLAARGRVEDLGCRPVSDGRAFNIEAVCATHEHPPFSKSQNTPALTEVADGAAVYSELLYSPIGAADPAAERVAAAAVCRTNSAGGVTFTASFDAQYSHTAQNLRRKAWVVGALRSLDPAFAVVCENAEPNLTQARRGRDGKTYAITLNVSYDDIAELRYSAARSMEGAEILGADGKWLPANAKSSDGVWTFPQRLACMEFALVRW